MRANLKELSEEFHAKFGRRVYDGLGAHELGGFFCMQQPENYEYSNVFCFNYCFHFNYLVNINF